MICNNHLLGFAHSCVSDATPRLNLNLKKIKQEKGYKIIVNSIDAMSVRFFCNIVKLVVRCDLFC